MKFSNPLVEGRLLRRYKRFLADIELASGETVVAHCANPGSMAGLAEPDSKVWLSPANSPARKLRWTWELVEDPLTGGLVGINTGKANAIVEEALRDGWAGDWLPYATLKREVRYGAGSRVDFLLSAPEKPDCFLEIKSVTLRRSPRPPHVAEFPDAVTARGARHLHELAATRATGARAVLLYLVQRDDCAAVRLAADIDPAYAEAAVRARDAGVEFMAAQCSLTPQAISAGAPLPLEF